MSSTHFARNAIMYAIFAAFGGFVFGLDAANISGALKYVTAFYELDNDQKGLLASIPLIGVIVALLFTGALCERFGRKNILLAIALTYALSSLMSAFAMSYHMLLIGRFIGGVAFASLTVSAMYIGEIAPADKRGRYVSMAQLLIVLGSLLAFIVNYFLAKMIAGSGWLSDENVWRYMLGFELIANFIWVVLILKIPKSPRWLIKHGREAEAREVLSTLQPEAEIEATVKDVKASLGDTPDTTPLQQLGLLFSKRMRLILAIAVVYAITQGATGMNVVLFYAPLVFEQVGTTSSGAFFQTIILGIVSVIGTIIAMTFVEKIGRRTLTLFGLLLIILSHTSIWYGFNNATYNLDAAAIESITDTNVDKSKLVTLSGNTYASDVALKKDLASVYSLKELPIVTGRVINATIDINPLFVLIGIFAFVTAFNISIGPIMWVIFSEVFPTAIRSVAMPFAAMVQTLSSYMIARYFPWLSDNLGSANTFLLYAVIGVIGLAVMIFILPETKGKTIEEIERDLVKT